MFRVSRTSLDMSKRLFIVCFVRRRVSSRSALARCRYVKARRSGSSSRGLAFAINPPLFGVIKFFRKPIDFQRVRGRFSDHQACILMARCRRHEQWVSVGTHWATHGSRAQVDLAAWTDHGRPCLSVPPQLGPAKGHSLRLGCVTREDPRQEGSSGNGIQTKILLLQQDTAKKTREEALENEEVSTCHREIRLRRPGDPRAGLCFPGRGGAGSRDSGRSLTAWVAEPQFPL